MIIRRTAIGAILMAMAATTTVQAVPIDGNISIDGLATLDNSDLYTATTVESWQNVYVGAESGAFAIDGIPLSELNELGTVALSSPWVFNPYQPPFSNPNNPQFTWSVGDFTFTMISDSVSVTDSGMFLDVLGYGTITSTDPSYDPTQYYWNFQTETPPPLGGPAEFVFSATTVPDGGFTLALLGLTFAGMEGLRRKLRTLKN